LDKPGPVYIVFDAQTHLIADNLRRKAFATIKATLSERKSVGR